ncbi:MAG: LamG domain-containing protein, partial [Anaerohalosphaera sp.]|nr:LamG domain-containing protein [Anaerohalosphaera sp.]
GWNKFVPSPGYTLDTAGLFVISHQGGTHTYSDYALDIDGVAAANATNQAGNKLAMDDSTIRVGNRDNQNPSVTVDIAEVLFFNRYLNDFEMNHVGTYLADKYGLSTTYTDPGAYTTVIAPTAGGGDVDSETTFEWAGLNGTGMTYVLSYVVAGSGDPATEVVTTDTTHTASLKMNTEYEWSVSVQGGNAGSVQTFTTAGAITLLDPPDGTVGVEQNLAELTWQEVIVSGVSYRVNFGTDPNLMAVVATVTEASYPLPEVLDSATAYYWSVDAVTNTDEVTGAVSSFTTGGFTHSPFPSDGNAGASIEPVLLWSGDRSSSYMDSFEVYIGDSAGALTLVDTITETSYVISGTLAEDVTKFWKVVGLHDGVAINSDHPVWSFTTGKLLAHWSLEGDYVDSVAGMNGAILKEDEDAVDPNWISGPKGQALEFRGASLIAVADSTYWDPTYESLTIASWVRYAEADTTNSNKGVVTKHGETTGYKTGTEGWAFDFYDFRGTPTMSLSGIESSTERVSCDTRVDDGLWHHVVLIWDGANRYAYIDGQPVELWEGLEYLSYDDPTLPKIPTTGEILPTTAPIGIGGTCNPDGTFFEGFDGAIDEVLLYSRALTESEVQALYADSNVSTLPSPEDGAGDVEWNPTLGWAPGTASGIVGQKLYIADNDDFTGATAVDLSPTDNAVDIATEKGSNLELDTMYYWRVDTIGAGDVVLWEGLVWTFTVRDLKGDITDDGTTDLPDKVVNNYDLIAMAEDWLVNDETPISTNVVAMDQEDWGTVYDPNDYHEAPVATYGWGYATLNYAPKPGNAQNYNAGDDTMYHDPGSQTLILNYNKRWGGPDGTNSVTNNDFWSYIELPEPIDTLGYAKVGFWVKKRGGSGSFYMYYNTPDGWVAVLNWVGNFYGLEDDKWIYLERDITGWTAQERQDRRYLRAIQIGSWGGDDGTWQEFELSDIVLVPEDNTTPTCWIGVDGEWGRADLNQDCTVNLFDTAIFADNWLVDAN